MGFNCGIVGMPNVGKSTLFNALTSTAAAEAANYPFCTIEPNTGRVSVPDLRLDSIAALAKSAKILPTHLEFVDIAGLVRGASQGEGLGNQFLANIRETDAIVHVLRCFEDGNVTHVEGSVDPVRDAETVETELMLSDLESLERRILPLEKKARGGDKDSKAQMEVMNRVLEVLRAGEPARMITDWSKTEAPIAKALNMLSSKPVLYVCNVEEECAGTGNAFSEAVAEKAANEGAESVVISAAIESEISQLGTDEEKQEFLETLGLEEASLARVIKAGYQLLDLLTFFTAGPKETRAWTIYQGSKAPRAAGAIHTDFERGFIRAETIAYEDFVSLGGEQGAKDAGKMRSEGSEYLVQDGDVLLFRFNV
jgi:GTP-binding protein YchF